MAVSYRISIILVFILILASALRIHGLGHQSLWNDELASWDKSNYSNLGTVIKKGVIPDMHPPGYHVVTYFVEKYIGTEESALRLPSAISGILSVLVIFLLGERLYSCREGLIASAMTAVLWCPIYYSQEGRAYSMLLLFTLLATYFWVTMLMRLNEDRKISLNLKLGYVLSAIAASYLHYFGLFLIALQALWSVLFFIKSRSALITLLSAYFFILMAYVPWLPIMAQHLSHGNVSDKIGWIKPPGNIIVSFRDYLLFIFNDSLKIVILAVGMYVFLFFHTLYNSKKFKGQKNVGVKPFPAEWLLFSWLFIPFLIAYFKSIISFPVLVNYVLIISLPAAYLLFSRAITQLLNRPMYQAIITVMLVMYSLHWLVSDGYYSTPRKEQWREAVYFMADNDKYYKNSLIIGYAWVPRYFDYYLKKKGSVKSVHIMAGEEKDIPIITGIINTENPGYVWYIYGQRSPDKKFINFMKKRLSLIEEKKFIDTGVFLFKNK